MEYEKVKSNSERWLDLKNLKNEEWQDVLGYEGIYKVSNYGRVKALSKLVWNRFKDVKREEHILKVRYVNGYNVSILYFNKRQRQDIGVHRLVCQAFISNPNNYPFVNHLNRN